MNLLNFAESITHIKSSFSNVYNALYEDLDSGSNDNIINKCIELIDGIVTEIEELDINDIDSQVKDENGEYLYYSRDYTKQILTVKYGILDRLIKITSDLIKTFKKDEYTRSNSGFEIRTNELLSVFTKAAIKDRETGVLQKMNDIDYKYLIDEYNKLDDKINNYLTVYIKNKVRPFVLSLKRKPTDFDNEFIMKLISFLQSMTELILDMRNIDVETKSPPKTNILRTSYKFKQKRPRLVGNSGATVY